MSTNFGVPEGTIHFPEGNTIFCSRGNFPEGNLFSLKEKLINRNDVKKREIFLKELFDLLKEILGINLPEGLVASPEGNNLFSQGKSDFLKEFHIS